MRTSAAIGRDGKTTRFYYATLMALNFEMLRFLSLAWQSKFNYGKAISYSQKLVDASQNSEFKFRYRQGLYEYGNLLSAAGQEQRAKTMYGKGLNLSLSAKDDTQGSIFLSTLLLNALYQNDLTTAEYHVRTLAVLDKSKSFEYEVTLGHAILNALQDNAGESERQFSRLETMKSSSSFVVPYWKATIAERAAIYRAVAFPSTSGGNSAHPDLLPRNPQSGPSTHELVPPILAPGAFRVPQ